MNLRDLLSRIVDDAKLAFDPRNMVAGAEYALDDPVGFGQDFIRGYAELIRNPRREFSEHPLLSAMAVAPVVPPAVRLSKLMSNRTPDMPDRLPQNEVDDILAQFRETFPDPESREVLGAEFGSSGSFPEEPVTAPWKYQGIRILGEQGDDIAFGLPLGRMEELLRSAREGRSSIHGEAALDDVDMWDSSGPHNDPLNDVMDGLFDVHRNPDRLFAKKPLDAPEGRGPSGEYRALNPDRYGEMDIGDFNTLMHHGYSADEIRRMTPEEIDEAFANLGDGYDFDDIPDDLFDDVFGEAPAGMDDVIDPEVFNDRLNDNYFSEFADPNTGVQEALAEMLAKYGYGNDQMKANGPQLDLGQLMAPYEPEPRYSLFEESTMIPSRNSDSSLSPMFRQQETAEILKILARLRAQRGF